MFSIAVFGPIVNEGYVNADSGPELRCVFNGNAGACRFGVALGLGAFLACSCFLLLDVRFQQISSVRDRRRAVLLDLGFSGGGGRGGYVSGGGGLGGGQGRGSHRVGRDRPGGGVSFLFGPGACMERPSTCPSAVPQASGPSCGSWAFVSSPTSGSARRPGRAQRRRGTRRAPSSPSASSPSSAG